MSMMARTSLCFIFFFLLFNPFAFAETNTSAPLSTTVASPNPLTTFQMKILFDFYNSTAGPQWKRPWIISNPDFCTWPGVSCDVPGVVTRIIMQKNQLLGTIPNSIGLLPGLSVLDLSDGDISGTIPESLGSAKNLIKLRLAQLNLSGTIPAAIFQSSKLQVLQIQSPNLSGGLPANISLPNILVLAIYQTQMVFSFPSAVCAMPKLFAVGFFWMQGLTGTLPDCICDLKRLLLLGMFGNQLSGTIPPCLDTLPILTHIFLYDNALSGTINLRFEQMPNLKELHVKRNQVGGTIPSNVYKASNLQKLFLDTSNIGGTIPSTLGQLKYLYSMDLGRSKISGTIPPELGQMESLKELALSANSLSGTIPPELAMANKMTLLSLASNNLTGTFPAAFSNLTNLRFIDLSHNRLTGPVRSVIEPFVEQMGPCILVGCDNGLFTLDIRNNNFSGTIPHSISNLQTLRNLYLGSNPITGPLPSLNWDIIEPAPLEYRWAAMAEIVVIDLSNTDMSGAIPERWGAIQTLRTVILTNTLLVWKGVLPPYWIPDFQTLTAHNQQKANCPKLKHQLYSLDVSIDPDYYGYSLCTCFDGYYRGPDNTCIACPFGTNCTDGNLSVLPNFWVDDVLLNTSGIARVLRCPLAYCQTKITTNVSEQCGGNRQGVLCGSCKDGFSVQIGSPQCRASDQCTDKPLLFSMLFFLCLVAVIYLVLSSKSVNMLSPFNSLRASIVSFMFFYQILPMLLSTASRQRLGVVLSVLFDILNLRPSTSEGSYALCAFRTITPFQSKLSVLLVPLFLLVFIVLLLFLKYLRRTVTFHHGKFHMRECDKETHKEVKIRDVAWAQVIGNRVKIEVQWAYAAYVHALLIVLRLAYTSILKTALELLTCVRVGAGASSRQVLLIAGDVECYTTAQIAIAAVAVLLVAYPIVLFLLELKISRTPRSRQSHFFKCMSFQLGIYFKIEFVWWDAILVVWRLLFVMVCVFANDRPSERAYAMSVLCTLVLCSTLMLHPFHDRISHLFDVMVSLCLLAISFREIALAELEEIASPVLLEPDTKFGSWQTFLVVVPLPLLVLPAAWSLWKFREKYREIKTLQKATSFRLGESVEKLAPTFDPFGDSEKLTPCRVSRLELVGNETPDHSVSSGEDLPQPISIIINDSASVSNLLEVTVIEGRQLNFGPMKYPGDIYCVATVAGTKKRTLSAPRELPAWGKTLAFETSSYLPPRLQLSLHSDDSDRVISRSKDLVLEEGTERMWVELERDGSFAGELLVQMTVIERINPHDYAVC